MGDQLDRLADVMQRLRADCPWDAEQTHRTLASYLVEETAEVVEALEVGDDADLLEELGDLLLQVYFHAEIARTEGRFDIEDVAQGIADKLVRRHPHVFGDAVVADVDELWVTWEAAKKAEKQRTSALDGIPASLDVLARLHKTVLRARKHQVPLELPDAPIASEQVGRELLALVARAQASGVDPDQAARDALRELEANIRRREAETGSPSVTPAQPR